ncbi:MAG: sugar kinase [Kiritimatiellae bacterium]|nr:sugar kinase [Kiritimatiellia bacterium]
MPEIVTIGEALVEVMRTERDQPLDRPAPFSGPYPSGAPAIFADAAARLGASAGFVGTVGEDPFGDCLISRLAADGVDCAAVRRTAERVTGIAFVAYRSDGSRSFLFHLPLSAAALVDEAQIPPGYLAGARGLHVMGSALAGSESMRQACYAAARIVKRAGGTVSLDPNLRPELMPVDRIREICQPVLELADIVLPSGNEAAALTGEPSPENAARALLARGVRLVALKQGEAGSTLYAPDRVIAVPPFAVSEVDPTGAGDCYDAAFLVGHVRGWPLEQTGRFANAAGALATTRLGPMEGVFDAEVVRAFMAD